MAWMRARGISKGDKMKILASFDQLNQGAPFDERVLAPGSSLPTFTNTMRPPYNHHTVY